MQFVSCTYELHATAILDIFNEAIANSTALYDYKPRTLEMMQEWFRVKQVGSFPVIGLVDDNGQLMGFASYGTFRVWAAYKYTVEHAIYIHQDHRGKGLGRILLNQLIEYATEQQLHVMIGGIDIANHASIALHEKLGFKHSGTIQQAAFKFGRWLDLGFYQLILPTPLQPIDG
ncbi:GNAT family N-acetyltransferase [Aquirhabdus parva]|uniref:N-acetyltransferase n=1 Tax=Aquirhabdus parva TaxID=2283318 RepID=A0A345P593_9GAMM|nr:GNAT family N-acetyltransferase [Aquirhabdus parva]AXI02452.1 N-acetyltransferase [Aquirhabdus parva]